MTPILFTKRKLLMFTFSLFTFSSSAHAVKTLICSAECVAYSAEVHGPEVVLLGSISVRGSELLETFNLLTNSCKERVKINFPETQTRIEYQAIEVLSIKYSKYGDANFEAIFAHPTNACVEQ